MKRILILGVSGTGKSRLARRLSKKTNIPVTYCDAIAWKSEWAPEDPSKVESKIKQALSEEKWIIEGYIEPLARDRVAKADLIIYLDYPGYLALLGGLKRWLKYRGKERPEMQPGNKEELVPRILWSMLRRSQRPEIETILSNQKAKIVRLKSWESANDFNLPIGY